MMNFQYFSTSGFDQCCVQPPGGDPDILASRWRGCRVVHHVLREMNPVLIQQFEIHIFYSVHIILHSFFQVQVLFQLVSVLLMLYHGVIN